MQSLMGFAQANFLIGRSIRCFGVFQTYAEERKKVNAITRPIVQSFCSLAFFVSFNASFYVSQSFLLIFLFSFGTGNKAHVYGLMF